MAHIDLQTDQADLPGYQMKGHVFDTRDARHFIAEDGDGRAVLLRMPRRDQDLVKTAATYRFATQTARKLDGTGYIPCHDIRSRSGRPVMVLDAGRGTLLEKLIPAQGMRLDKLIKISAALATTLRALHMQGVAHRNLTPEQVLVDSSDDTCRMLSLETAAMLQHGVQTSDEDVTVDARYAAPEMSGCMEVAVDLRADLYALGAVLFRMATGRPPYLNGGNRPLAYAHVTQPIPDLGALRPELPDAFCNIVVKLLQKDPDARYDTANGVTHDLSLCAAQFRRSGTVRSFPIGEHDTLSRFEISDKPYGRSQEIETLLAACDLKQKDHRRTVISISGPSGIGKTTVVNRLRVPLAIAGVQFVTGKFDQFLRDTPYLAFTEVAANLSRLQMRLDPTERAEVQAQYKNAVGEYGGLLTELVPQLIEVLGPQPDVSDVSPNEAAIRFNGVVGRFFRAMATQDRPMVMFIDDVQWADPASLRIMEALAQMDGLENFTMILGYRSDEVAEGHPAAQLLAHTRLHVERYIQIDVGPLGQRDVRDMLSDALQRTGADVDAVADLVHGISSGNPFFVREFLISLRDRGYINFDVASGDWMLDLESIADVSVPDSVARMLADRLVDMPRETLDLLDIASCIGNGFDLLALSNITGRSLSRIASDLKPAVEGSLIKPLGSNQRLFEALDEDDSALELSRKLGNARYRFHHDQARLAAHEQMTQERRADLHMRIARLMTSSLSPEQQDRQAVEIFGHLEFGAKTVKNITERVGIARIGVTASRASRKGLAFVTARAQLVTASALMPENAWNTHQDLMLQLQLGLAECAYALNDRVAMEAAASSILTHVTDPVKTVPLQIMRVSYLSTQNEFEEAVDITVSVARTLGVSLPRKPSKFTVLRVALRAVIEQSGRDPRTYHDLPETEDQNIRDVLKLIGIAATPAYFAMPNLLPILGITGAQLSIKHGVAPDSPYCLAVQGLVYCGPLNMVERGYRFGELANEIGNRYGGRDRSRGHYVYNVFVRHWKRPYAQVALALLDAWNANRDAGEHESATYCGGVLLYTDWFSGRGVDIEARVPDLLHYLRTVDMRHVTAAFLAWMELFRALQATDLADDLRGELHDYVGEMPGYKGNRVLISITSIAAGILDFFAGRHIRAEQRFALAAKYEEQITAQPLVPGLCFMRALNGYKLAQSGHHPPSRDVAKACKRLRAWAAIYDGNAGQMVALLEAEQNFLRGDTSAGLQDLDRAVDFAGDTAPLYTMLAETRRAEVLRDLGQNHVAQAAAQRAIQSARRWGATAVVNDLRERFSIPEAQDMATNTLGSTDLADVLDSVAAIAMEKDRNPLLERILESAIRIANADSGVLVQIGPDGHLYAQTMCRPNRQIETHQFQLDQIDPIWARATERCIATGKTLVSNAPGVDFLNAPSSVGKDAKSLLCVPIHVKDRTVGAICLTNHLARHVFDTARARIAEAVSSQAGIALENTQLYNAVQDALARQTAQTEANRRFVPEALLQALGQRAITDVQLDNVVEQDLSVVFVDIRNFTSISRQIGANRTIQMINRYLSHVQAGIAAHGGFVGNYMGDGLIALFPGRMDDALHGVIAMSRGLDGYNRDRGDFPELSIGLGVNRGPVMLGMIGDEDHIQCGVLGDAVNIASRIEALTKTLGAQFLLHGNCVALLEDPTRFLLRPVGKYTVRGHDTPLELFECLDVYPEAVYLRLSETRKLFARAVSLAESGDTEGAASLFDQCDAVTGGDPVAKQWAERCRT